MSHYSAMIDSSLLCEPSAMLWRRCWTQGVYGAFVATPNLDLRPWKPCMTALSLFPKAEGIFSLRCKLRARCRYGTRSFLSATIYPGIKSDVIESSV